jgi:hypothetical protein
VAGHKILVERPTHNTEAADLGGRRFSRNQEMQHWRPAGCSRRAVCGVDMRIIDYL